MVAYGTCQRQGSGWSTTAACALPDPVVHARKPFMGDRALSAQNDFVVHHLCYSCVIFTGLADRSCLFDPAYILNLVHHVAALQRSLVQSSTFFFSLNAFLVCLPCLGCCVHLSLLSPVLFSILISSWSWMLCLPPLVISCAISATVRGVPFKDNNLYFSSI